MTQTIGLQETLVSLGENVDLRRDLIMLPNVFIDLFVHNIYSFPTFEKVREI